MGLAVVEGVGVSLGRGVRVGVLGVRVAVGVTTNVGVVVKDGVTVNVMSAVGVLVFVGVEVELCGVDVRASFVAVRCAVPVRCGDAVRSTVLTAVGQYPVAPPPLPIAGTTAAVRPRSMRIVRNRLT